ncbi:hypothetical protein RUND412_006000 [Rhizina undulata]
MEGLPAEILQEIVGHLSRGDLDSVRLVNHELSAAANVFKYGTLRVPVSRKGLDDLLYVSQQPALAYCVREIVYPWRHLPPLVEPSSRYGRYDYVSDDPSVVYMNDPISEFNEIFDMADIFVKWYNDKIYTPQTELENSGECVEAMEAALTRMSNIRILQPGFCADDFEVEFEKWCGTLTGTVSGNIKMDWECIWHLIIYPNPTKDSEERLSKHILDLIYVSYRVGLRPDVLGSSITGESLVLWPGFFSDHSSEILQNCAPLIENLTSLSLTLDKNIQFGRNQEEEVGNVMNLFRKGLLYKFLSLTINLRFLSLRLCPVKSLDNTYIFSLLDVFGHTRIWKHLHTLDFSPDNAIELKDLVVFLRCHSKTLKALSLTSITIFGGTCRDLLDFLKDQLHLTKFELSFCYERLPNSRR